MPIARCPVCEDILTLGSDLTLSQPITCSTCLSNLKIVSLEPCELEEANRRPLRQAQSGQTGRSNSPGPRREPAGGKTAPYGSGNYRPPQARPNDRRPPAPSLPPVFPPNPDKQVDTRRAQKWEKPKVEETDPEEEDGFEEFEDKLYRNRSGKNKRNK